MERKIGWKPLAALLAAALALSLSLTLGGPASAAPRYVMKLAHNMPPNPKLLYHAHALKFQELLRKYSGGQADARIFPSSQLGSDTVAAKKVQLGSVETQIVAANNLVTFYPPLDLFTLPFLFPTFEGAFRVFEGDVGAKLAQDFRSAAKIRVLGWIATGFRNITNSKRPILKPEDLKGLRIRIAENPIMVSTYRALGGSTITMAPSEVFSALAQGVVDGQDGGSSWAWAQKFYEVQKYLSVTNHQLVVGAFIINEPYFQRLPKDVQAVVLRAGKESTDFANKYAQELDRDVIQRFASKGLKVSRPDIRPFQERVMPVYREWAGRVGGMPLVERTLKIAGGK